LFAKLSEGSSYSGRRLECMDVLCGQGTLKNAPILSQRERYLSTIYMHENNDARSWNELDRLLGQNRAIREQVSDGTRLRVEHFTM
jgi:hypothetical protein